MQRKFSLTTAALACALFAPLSPLGAGAAHAAPASVEKGEKGVRVEEIKADVAEKLQVSMRDLVARRALYNALAADGEADLTTVLANKHSAYGDLFTRQVAAADTEVKKVKGLDGMVASGLRVRVADEKSAGQLTKGVQPLFAPSPTEDNSASLVARDIQGDSVRVDLDTPTDVPLLLVELDIDNIMPVAVGAVSAELKRQGVESEFLTGREEQEPAHAVAPGASAAAATKIVTRLNTVKLNKDHEPWWKGRAEIYAVAMGQGKDNKARADVVSMPYLDYDDTTYYPGQGIIDWSHFKWNNVDFLVMEQDDNTNYNDLAKVIAGAIATLAGGPQYVPLINEVLNALPSSWTTDDDDYVDSFYMLSRQSNGLKIGASNNARVTVQPVVVTT
jgi:hypothetical protein